MVLPRDATINLRTYASAVSISRSTELFVPPIPSTNRLTYHEVLTASAYIHTYYLYRGAFVQPTQSHPRKDEKHQF